MNFKIGILVLLVISVQDSDQGRLKRALGLNIPYIANCNFLQCAFDIRRLIQMRNSVPVVEVFRRWSGKDGIPILEKLDKKSAKLEKMYRMHNETIEALQAKLERLQEKEGNI